MSKETTAVASRYGHQAAGIDGFDSLADLALNLRWSWNHATDDVWRQLDLRLWEITNDHWVVLQAASRDKMERVLSEPVFRKNAFTRTLPQLPQGFNWHLAVDTSASAPQDLFTAGEEPAVDHSKLWSLKPRASAIFVTRKAGRNADH